ncbi:transcription termination protein NusB [Bacteroides reticulotermitis JCM 10512]|uniref:Transcription termination protein NusB n=1 Tax=Bacteroides reticulotermitis JCM 10512 TaxID=1445607 RepID=W4UW14_9BACE|nr:transcription termination protein NusB [Bacteroides reticulotermitis JCM 10512]
MCRLAKNIYFCSSIITVLIRIMINRVLIRLKIIQIVYAYYQNGSKNLDSAEKELFFSLSKAYDLYNYLLMLMIALTEYAQKRIDTAKAKLAPSKDELYPNMKFVENKFIAQLEVNKQLSQFVANQKRTWANDQDFVKEFYEKIVESDIYKDIWLLKTTLMRLTVNYGGRFIKPMCLTTILWIRYWKIKVFIGMMIKKL